MKLADFRMNVRMERRQLQWRVSLGLWIALAAGMIAFKNARIPVSEWILVPILAGVLVGHAVLWAYGNWLRNERDAKQAYQMIANAEALLGVRYRPPRRTWEKLIVVAERKMGLKPGRLRIFTHSPPFFEMLATFLLVLAWCIVNAY